MQSLRGGFVSVVSAVCLVHFLTLVSNLSKNSNNEHGTRFVSVVSVRADTFRGFVSVVSSPFHVSACKVITFLHILQMNLQKSFIKNCKRIKKQRFGVFVAWCVLSIYMPRKIVFYICIRACVCVRMCAA